jgi:hypothetical protein
MGSLSNLYISSSFQSLIHLGNDNTASTAYTVLQDGFGNDLGVSLNTRGEIKSAGLLVSGAVDINTTFSGSTQGFVNQSSTNNLIRITGSYTTTGNQASITEIGIGWLVNGGAVSNGRVINVSGTPNSDVTYTIDQFYTANNVTYTFTGSIERAVDITGDLDISDDLFVGGHLTIEDGVEITGSIDITGNVTASNAFIENDLIVSGTISAFKIVTTIESASVIFSSGSNILGDETSDTQTLNGTIIMSGSSSLTGSMGITGNLNVLGNISSSTLSGVGNVTAYSAAVDARFDTIESFTGSYATTGSNSFNGNQTITGSLTLSSSAAIELNVIGNSTFSGSVRGVVNTLSITSNTASMDCSLGNFFTLNLTSATTRLVPTNILPGETISLRVTQASTPGNLIFTNVLFASGAYYAPTQTSGAVDIMTFISYDTSSLYSVGAKGFTL